MPFGLHNVPAIFQLLMKKVLATCRDFSAVYIDDVLIFSKSWSEHLAHVQGVLLALREAGLTAKPAKCQWGLDYLGHRVGCGKVAMSAHRATAMAACQSARRTCALSWEVSATIAALSKISPVFFNTNPSHIGKGTRHRSVDTRDAGCHSLHTFIHV